MFNPGSSSFVCVNAGIDQACRNAESGSCESCLSNQTCQALGCQAAGCTGCVNPLNNACVPFAQQGSSFCGASGLTCRATVRRIRRA